MAGADGSERPDGSGGPGARLFELWGEIVDLGRAAAVLEWDQETQMPPKGFRARGKLQATLAGARHARLNAPELADAIEAAAEQAPPQSELAAQVREARRAVRRVARVPEKLQRELAEAQTLAHESWRAAREASDFGLFERDLAHLIRLKREEAGLVAGEGGRPYDALLDDFEPGATEEDLVPLFETLRRELTPIVRAVAECGREVDESPARGRFPADAQLAFGRRIAERMGFDFQSGRIDRAAHPFCSGFDPSDVRITWRHQEDDFRPALFGIMHEAGHGLYEQGLPAELQRTPIGEACSLGVHESQSRLWENLVGRSRAFWRFALPLFHEHFPEASGVTVDALWPALHTIKPSLIRVEADQGTYDLHVAVRFEIERRIFSGELEAGDLPAAWDDAYEDLLGVRPRNAAEGVLQDIHWSFGGFGYFPTYTLGNLINAQLFRAAGDELGDLDAMFAAGELHTLLDWLRDKIHRHGSRYPARELVQRATGRPLSPDDFLAQRRETAEAVYGVTV